MGNDNFGIAMYALTDVFPEDRKLDVEPNPDGNFIHHNRYAKNGLGKLNERYAAFGIEKGYKLQITGNSAAFEFGLPSVAGTGSLAMVVHDGHFVISNSGHFIKSMVETHHKIGGSLLSKARPGTWIVESAWTELLRSLGRKDKPSALAEGKFKAWARFAFGAE